MCFYFRYEIMNLMKTFFPDAFHMGGFVVI